MLVHAMGGAIFDIHMKRCAQVYLLHVQPVEETLVEVDTPVGNDALNEVCMYVWQESVQVHTHTHSTHTCTHTHMHTHTHTHTHAHTHAHTHTLYLTHMHASFNHMTQH